MKKYAGSVGYKLNKLNNTYLVVKSAVALTFVFIAFKLFTLIKVQTDAAKLSLALLGTIILILALSLIVEYIVKTLWLQNETKVRRFSSIISLNGFFGLVLPLCYINVLMSKILVYLSSIRNYGTVFCDIRWSIIRYYEMNNVYGQLSNFIFWTALILLALFLWGAVLERRK